MAKANKDKIEVVKINPTGVKDAEGNELEEVFFYREDPYVNEAKYVKAGTYKLGAVEEKKVEEG
jgi:hypothetical protein